jgi:hypothetical protein
MAAAGQKDAAGRHGHTAGNARGGRKLQVPRFRDVVAVGVLMGVGAVVCCGAAEEDAAMVRIEPRETADLFTNPGMGWQTFHRFADEDPHLAGLPSGSAYFRFYWSELEPEEGKIDFDKLDGLLAHARAAGQKLGLRVMCASTNRHHLGSPQWLRDAGCRGFEYRSYRQGPFWVPDFEDPIFQRAHFRLLEELGKRYDGHPDLDYIDIGSVGLWGEWHMSGTNVDMPPLSARLAVIDAYLRSFPNTPKLMQIDDIEGMRYAVERGCGWRADCLGDMRGPPGNWNHMEDAYPQAVRGAHAQDAWKKAPVAWETCWTMTRWVNERWDVRYIYDYALDYHGSYVNNKSSAIPEGARAEVERLLGKLGYRLVLRSLEHSAGAQPGRELNVMMEWDNVGVAPPYRDYVLAFRLTDSTGSTVLLVTDRSVKGWLPGRTILNETVRLPDTIALGAHSLALAVVDPKTKEPAVCLAIEGRADDGWYPLSTVEVTP